jgi:hypothetical protein
LPEALLQRVKAIMAFTEGDFEPSPPPALLDRLTDQVLVVASDAVHAAAAAVDWLARRQCVREDRAAEMDEHPTEVYEDLAAESWRELCEREQDEVRGHVS